MKTCITVACFVAEKDKVLFLEHKGLGKWLPPGGHLEPNETPTDAVQREVLEETGYSIEIIDTDRLDNPNMKPIKEEGRTYQMIRPMIILLEHLDYGSERHDHFDLVYAATINKGKRIINAESSKSMKWLSLAEIKALDTPDNCKELAGRAIDLCKRATGKEQ